MYYSVLLFLPCAVLIISLCSVLSCHKIVCMSQFVRIKLDFDLFILLSIFRAVLGYFHFHANIPYFKVNIKSKQYDDVHFPLKHISCSHVSLMFQLFSSFLLFFSRRGRVK